MKTLRLLPLTLVLAAAAILAGCGHGDTYLAAAPPPGPGQAAQLIELGFGDFGGNPHISRELEIIRPGSLIVSLETNEALGLAWKDQPEVSSGIVAPVAHALATPAPGEDTAAVGEPARDVWVFDSREAGSGMLRFTWGDTAVQNDARWTLTVYVTVE